MRLPKPTLVVFLGVFLTFLMAASAHAMLKKNAEIRHNRWQHTQCSAGPRTCVSPGNCWLRNVRVRSLVARALMSRAIRRNMFVRAG